MTAELVETVIKEELARARDTVDTTRYQSYQCGADLLRELLCAKTFIDFLTVPAYTQMLESEGTTTCGAISLRGSM